jgi:hypothetical protein
MVCPYNSNAEILTTKMMVLEGRALMRSINAFLRGPEKDHWPFP